LTWTTRRLAIRNNGSRNETRKNLVLEFLKEKAGTGTGDKATNYRYSVERLKGDRWLFITRPTWKKGFDFQISLENWRQTGSSHKVLHSDITDDLKTKKIQSPESFKLLSNAINQVYLMNDPKDVLRTSKKMHFGKGLRIDLILCVLKWFFLLEEILYWNYNGRRMLKSGLNEILDKDHRSL
jgi:hypothetical protein